MCGLIGVVNRETNKFSSEKLIKVFSQGLYCDALRGKHGTGIMGVTNKSEIAIYKRALAAADFLELKAATKIIDDTDNVFLMGHNRYATLGSHTADNTHPFSHNQIHLFHNGTLDAFRTLNPGKTFTVDSDALCCFLSNSIDVAKSLEEIEGAYSLVWYDEAEETLNFARNKERPMFFGILKDSASFIYASEPDMITWLAARNSINLEKIISTAVGKLISVPLSGKSKTQVTSFTPKEPVPYTHYYQSKSYGNKNNFNYETNTEKSTVGGKEVAIVGTPGKYSHLKGTEIVLEVGDWTSYNHINHVGPSFGFVIGSFNEELNINVGSIPKAESGFYANKLVVVRITAAPSNTLAYGSIVRVATDEDVLTAINNEIQEIDIEIDNSEENETRELEVLGPFHRYITLTEFNKKVSDGCAHCNRTITVEDAPTLNWDYDGSVLCGECKTLYAI